MSIILAAGVNASNTLLQRESPFNSKYWPNSNPEYTIDPIPNAKIEYEYKLHRFFLLFMIINQEWQTIQFLLTFLAIIVNNNHIRVKKQKFHSRIKIE